MCLYVCVIHAIVCCAALCCAAPQEGIQLRLDKYPQTLVVDLGVAAMGVETPEGALIRTGAGLHRLHSGTNLPGALPGGACL